MASDARAFPFSAIVASDDLATALVLTTVAPEIGGVLVRGEKGTAKTTMVRALAHVLPEVSVVEGCRFSCDPADPDPGCPDAARHDGSTTRPARLVDVGDGQGRPFGGEPHRARPPDPMAGPGHHGHPARESLHGLSLARSPGGWSAL